MREWEAAPHNGFNNLRIEQSHQLLTGNGLLRWFFYQLKIWLNVRSALRWDLAKQFHSKSVNRFHHCFSVLYSVLSEMIVPIFPSTNANWAYRILIPSCTCFLFLSYFLLKCQISRSLIHNLKHNFTDQIQTNVNS